MRAFFRRRTRVATVAIAASQPNRRLIVHIADALVTLDAAHAFGIGLFRRLPTQIDPLQFCRHREWLARFIFIAVSSPVNASMSNRKIAVLILDWRQTEHRIKFRQLRHRISRPRGNPFDCWPQSKLHLC